MKIHRQKLIRNTAIGTAIGAGLGAAMGGKVGSVLGASLGGYLGYKSRSDYMPAPQKPSTPKKTDSEIISELKGLHVLPSMFFKIFDLSRDPRLVGLQNECGGDGDEYPTLAIGYLGEALKSIERGDTEIHGLVMCSYQNGLELGYDISKKKWIYEFENPAKYLSDSQAKQEMIKYYQFELDDWKKNLYFDEDSEPVIKYISELVKAVKTRL